tara:strand:+ start:170 stop:397 length:228 start_codon:yes stop_codon:yes gene_type:complete
MSGDYFTHTDRRYDEILERLDVLERKVANSKLMMKRTMDGDYERLVDVVVEHDKTITEIVEHTVGTLTESEDTNW